MSQLQAVSNTPQAAKAEAPTNITSTRSDQDLTQTTELAENVRPGLTRGAGAARVQRLVGRLQKTTDTATRQTAFRSLQRTWGNQVATSVARSYNSKQSSPTGKASTAPVVQRLPYAKAYTGSNTKSLLNESEGRASPVNAQEGHPRQHVGKWEKAERFAEEQGKTKSIYTNTEQQDKAISSALSSAAGQIELAKLDAAPAVATRVAIKDVATEAAEVKVVKAKKKKGAAAGEVKSWVYQSGTAGKATVIVDSMGTNQAGDIHVQTAFPVFE